MLGRIETKEKIPDFIAEVKEGKEEPDGLRAPGVQGYDPRAKIIKQATDDVFEATGATENPC